MSGGGLDNARIVELAGLAAGTRRLSATVAGSAEKMVIRVRPGVGFELCPGRNEVSVTTYGTGAFLIDFDDRWTWQAFAYDEQDQAETIPEIIDVAEHYLRGSGEVQVKKSLLRRTTSVLLIRVGSEKVVLKSRDGVQGGQEV